MYLSKLTLDPRNKSVKRDLADCHEAHRTMLSAFSDLNGKTVEARKDFGLLYRIDADRHTGSVIILVQSLEKPEWSRLPDGYLLAGMGMDNPAIKTLDEQYGHIKECMILSFRLKANPTKKIGTTTRKDVASGKPKSNGRRIPINDETEQLEWLKRKAMNGGFELITVMALPGVFDVMTVREDAIKGHVSHGIKMAVDGGDCKLLSLSSVLFEGRLRVTDKEKFLTTLKSGIGSGKAYGFGLMSIAKSR
jgi:CRISPR system Cascade subunit CasE